MLFEGYIVDGSALSPDYRAEAEELAAEKYSRLAAHETITPRLN